LFVDRRRCDAFALKIFAHKQSINNISTENWKLETEN